MWPTKKVYSGERIPTGYGYAWRMWNQDAVILMPIPFNLIAQLVRWLYFSSMHQLVLNELDKAENEGFNRGYKDGRRHVAAYLELVEDRAKREALEQHRRDIVPLFEVLKAEIAELRKQLDHGDN